MTNRITGLTCRDQGRTMASIRLGKGSHVNDSTRRFGLARHLLMFSLVALMVGAPTPAGAADFEVGTAAGVPGMSGVEDGAGVGGEAPFAKLGSARGATAMGGKIYFVEPTRIRRYDPVANQVVTIVGSTTPGYVDGNFSDARFVDLSEITDFEGDLYVAESHRVRKIDLGLLTVTTIAGSATPGSTDGQGVNASFSDVRGPFALGGMLYVVDSTDVTLRRIDPDTAQVTTLAGAVGQPGGQDGFGTAARFVSPRNLAGEGKFLYIADTNGSAIRRYNTETTEVTTIAGNGVSETLDGIGTAARVKRPRGMQVWGGYLYFADFTDHIIRRVNLQTLQVTTVAGTTADGGYVDGTGTNAEFSAPWGVTATTGHLYIIDTGNFLLRKMTVPSESTSVSLKVNKTAQKAKASGKVLPAHPGRKVSVSLYRKVNGAFKKKAGKTVVLSNTSSYSASFNRLGQGRCKFTTRWPGDEDSLARTKSVPFNC